MSQSGVAVEGPRFLFVTCQVGAERAVKGELARLWPGFHVAYSRPGFLTFKLPADAALPADFELGSVFARAYGFSLGPAAGEDGQSRARAVWGVYGNRPVRRLHVWPRDAARPGEHGFEPAHTPAAVAAAAAILSECPRPVALANRPAAIDVAARPGDFVLDCILLEEDQWWVGYHQAGVGASCWPGGMMSLEVPPTWSPALAEDGRGPALVPLADPGRRPLCGDRQRRAGPARHC